MLPCCYEPWRCLTHSTPLKAPPPELDTSSSPQSFMAQRISIAELASLPARQASATAYLTACDSLFQGGPSNTSTPFSINQHKLAAPHSQPCPYTPPHAAQPSSISVCSTPNSHHQHITALRPLSQHQPKHQSTLPNLTSPSQQQQPTGTALQPTPTHHPTSAHAPTANRNRCRAGGCRRRVRMVQRGSC